MTKSERTKSGQSQKFIDYAREADADEDEKRWEERLKKIAEQKPDHKKG
jgi:hypothetical protein